MVAPKLENFIFSVQILTFYVNDLVQVQSSIGDLSLFYLRNFVNFFASEIAIPVVNQQLAQGVEIPRQYFGIVNFKDAVFLSKDNYLSVGVVPQFI